MTSPIAFARVTALAILLLLAGVAVGQEAEQEPAADTVADEATAEEAAPAEEAETPDGPRTMSGMSILGNEEAPKSLVIIPWKSSEMGADLDLSNSLDAEPEPVDRDVFLRELRFYEIRSGQ